MAFFSAPGIIKKFIPAMDNNQHLCNTPITHSNQNIIVQ